MNEACVSYKRFHVQISIELKIRIAWRVLNRFTWFNSQDREQSLSYPACGLCFLLVCQSIAEFAHMHLGDSLPAWNT